MPSPQSARLNQRVPLLVALIIVLGCLAGIVWDPPRTTLWLAAMIIALALTFIVVQARLAWSDQVLGVTAAGWRRDFYLDQLARIGYTERAGRVVILLEERFGYKIWIPLRRWRLQPDWSSAVLAAAERTGAEVDPRAGQALLAVRDGERGDQILAA